VINGNPLIINLETIDVDNANKVIAFLSGVVYAIEGETYVISEKIVLFGNSEVYDDGSVRKLLDEIEK
ncbi:MAG TPA: cell division protein SepF, partial [Acholeplasma sp.]|nr:cell division protein SepF [Acholeplasma sp.]